MSYLNNRNNITLPDGGKLFEGNGADDLLSIDMGALGVRTRGNIAVVLAAERHQGIETTRENMWAGIELKKEENERHAEIHRQVILQHLSASFLNPDTGIATIMTDLCDRWHFFWFSKELAALMQYKASKGEANYLIRHMMDQPDSSHDTSTPKDFLNRASWTEMFEQRIPPSDREDKETWSENDEDHDNADEDGKSQRRSVVYTTQHPSDGRDGAGPGGSHDAKQHARLEHMDFMDEEEEKEAIFKQVLNYSLPRMVYFPQRGEERKQNSQGPPRHVFIS